MKQIKLDKIKVIDFIYTPQEKEKNIIKIENKLNFR